MVFIGGIPFNQPDPNESYRLLLLGQEIDQLLGPEIDAMGSIALRYFNIKKQFPRWILEKSESVPPTTHIVNFTQAYYDWLYNFSDYNLVSKTNHNIGMFHIIDIDTTPAEYLKHFTRTYASGFPEWYLGITTDNPDLSSIPPLITPNLNLHEPFLRNNGVRTFIKNIRQSFYRRKSTEDAYRYFFSSLYGARQSTEFYYPKTDILRLNGGRFAGWNIKTDEGLTGHYGGLDGGDATSHLGGSYLNGRYRIQDSDWFQEYSYVIKGYVPLVNEETGLPIYFDILHEMLHPVGMKGFWEKTEDDFIPSGDFDGGFNLCESAKLDNYFPYRMNDDATLGYCAGCSGSGHTYDGPTAMFNGIETENLGGLNGWTYGSAWNGIGQGGICIAGTINSSKINGVVSASGSVTISDYSEINPGDKVTLIATDGTSHDFSCSAAPWGWLKETDAPTTATNLKNLIDLNPKYSASVESATVTITQAEAGSPGNTTITLSDTGDAGMTKEDFTGGVGGYVVQDAWGGIELSGQGRGITHGPPTYAYPDWSLGISGDVDQLSAFKNIYIREFVSLCPLENSPNLGLTGCTANSC